MKIAFVALSGLTFLCSCALVILAIVNAVSRQPRAPRRFVKSDDRERKQG